jgi:predicted RNase H-like HicB family nuclease
MDIPVLIEPLPDSGFRATSGEPLHLATEAPTREEAVAKLRTLIEERVAAGAQVVAVSIDTSHPLAKFAGMLKDDPLAEPWKQAMAEYRDARDADAP